MSYGFDKLLGKTVTKIMMNDDNDRIRFICFTDKEDGKTDMDILDFVADGDCCSNSWFNNITGIDNLLNETVTEIIEKEEKNLIHKDNTTEHDEEEISYYGYTFVTAKGYCDIEFRNSSNGYYGGSVEYSSEGTDDNMRKVLQDF